VQLKREFEKYERLKEEMRRREKFNLRGKGTAPPLLLFSKSRCPFLRFGSVSLPFCAGCVCAHPLQCRSASPERSSPGTPPWLLRAECVLSLHMYLAVTHILPLAILSLSFLAFFLFGVP
jgi:hypothetical protein